MTYGELAESKWHVSCVTSNFDEDVAIVFEDFSNSILKLLLIFRLEEATIVRKIIQMNIRSLTSQQRRKRLAGRSPGHSWDQWYPRETLACHSERACG
jgi:hypothetical protein